MGTCPNLVTAVLLIQELFSWKMIGTRELSSWNILGQKREEKTTTIKKKLLNMALAAKIISN